MRASWSRNSYPCLAALWPATLGAAVLVGAFLRLDQILSQVLIDDEWHAVHEVLQRTPAAMFVDFGWADYSIPLGILDWYEARWFGLSEIVLRAPMLACGLATLVVLPLYVAPRVGRATASVFAVLLAISPLLIIYSRMARPYAITLLLGWIAHGALVRYHASPRGQARAGLVYGTATTFAIWLHPIVGPFVLAPLLWEALQLRHAAGAADRRQRLLRLASVALPTSLAIAVLLLPPMVAHPESLLGKSGVDVPNLGTLVGVWYAWLGTGYTGALVICLALAAYGAGEIWRALPEAHTGSLGIALTLLAVMLTRPAWSANPATLARYLLPFLPLLLLAVAAGAIRAARRIATPGTGARRVLAAGMAALPCAALAFESPLAPMLQYPSTQTLGLVYYMDFRPAKNPFLPYTHAIPLSPFWQSLAAQPAGSIRIAAAPFYFESYNWDAARWERVSRQRVLPGYLTGLCVDQRGGEVPENPLFDFRNAVHLADERSLEQGKIDYVVWQKPYVQTSRGKLEPIGDDTAHCEPALRARFGAPAFEDPHLIAFRVSRQTESPHAQR